MGLLSKAEQEIMKRAGSVGGKKLVKNRGKRYLRELGRKGAIKRWGSIPCDKCGKKIRHEELVPLKVCRDCFKKMSKSKR